MGRPAISKKVDAWIDKVFERFLNAVPVANILIWGIFIIGFGYLAFVLITR